MTKTRKWLRRIGYTFGGFVALILVLIGGVLIADPGLAQLFSKPSAPFDPAHVPPAPDYAKADAWLARPGDNGLERSTPIGVTAIDEKSAPIDVFFIQPTTATSHTKWNADYDAHDKDAPIAPAVLMQQASVFNGCCRIYAPQFRQATLPGLGEVGPRGLAYSDVQRAFRYYLDHDNHGRPFILASHSQGTVHALRLVQEDILGTPLQQRLVAAYLIGSYVPNDMADAGLPICDNAKATGCVIAWNTSQTGRDMPRTIFMKTAYWWKGAIKEHGPEMACVNPLNWRREGAAPASANPGSTPLDTGPYAPSATHLKPLIQNATGAVCNHGTLDVDTPLTSPFRDKLVLLAGSYHLNDYGLFYAAMRQNASDRSAAWLAAHKGPRH